MACYLEKNISPHIDRHLCSQSS